MAGTPEEDLLEWLEREEERLGLDTIETGMEDIATARDLFYEELGYDITDSQFEALGHALEMRYEEFPAISTSYERIEQVWGFQSTYRDTITGRFVSYEDVQSALDILRGR